MKKILSILSYYILPITLLVLNLFFSSKSLSALLGNGAMIIVVAILFLKPLAKITNIKKLKRLLIYRRQFGVASFWLAAFHGLGMWQIVKGYATLNLYLNPQVNLLYGLMAAIGMLILGLSSNDLAVKILKRNWKRLQYIAYPTLFLILYHAALAENELMKFYIISGLFVILKILEWSKVSFNKSTADQNKNNYKESS